MADQRWMYLQNRTCDEYLTGLRSFIVAAETDKSVQRKSAICCPCIDCENIRKFSSSVHVHAHLIIRGFMNDYKCWNKHGEEGFNDQDLGADQAGQGISSDQQTVGQDGEERLSGSQDGEALNGNETTGHDVNEDDLAYDVNEDDLGHIGDKDELRVEVAHDIVSILESQGFQLKRISRNPSPASGRKSSCASASEAGDDGNDVANDPVQTQMEVEDAAQMEMEDAAQMEMDHAIDKEQMEFDNNVEEDQIPSPEVDSIDLLTEPTSCSLIAYLGAHQMEVAWGRVYPHQTVLHTVPILCGYAVVKVEFVHPKFHDHVLQPPPNDETITLGQAVNKRIQWTRTRIILNHVAMDGRPSQTVAEPKLPQTHKGIPGAAKSAPACRNLLNECVVASSTKSTRDDAQSVKQPQDVAAAVGSFFKRSAPESLQKEKVPSQKEDQPTNNSQKAACERLDEQHHPIDVVEKPNRPKKTGAAWTESNLNFVCGQPMLTTAALESVGPAAAALHEYYMKVPTAKLKNGIPILFKRSHFLRSLNQEIFNVGFGDIYELLNFDALDISILRCYTLLMLMETKAKGLPVGFLDPELMALSTIRADKSYVVDYVRKAFRSFVKKEFIIFAHNPGDHWLVVVLIPKWGKVLYFDSLRSRQQDHTLLKGVLDEAFLTYSTTYNMDTSKLTHVTKFPCHQQRPGNECGFYAAHHMTLALGLVNVTQLEDFEVMVNPLGEDVLDNIRERIASFLMTQVIDKKGEFYYKNPRVQSY